MSTTCFAPIFGKRIRVSLMDQCCRAVTGGDCEEVVTDGFVSLSLSSETEDGAEIITKKASGALCINIKRPDAFKRFTMEMEFCGVNPDLLSFMTNMSAYEDWDGNVSGATVTEGTVDKKFGLELWTGLADAACEPGVEEASGLFTLPCLNAGVLGDVSIDGENEISFSMTGAYTVSGHGWGTGIHDVVLNAGVPDLLPSAILPTEPLLILQTGVAPPPSACGCTAAIA